MTDISTAVATALGKIIDSGKIEAAIAAAMTKHAMIDAALIAASAALLTLAALAATLRAIAALRRYRRQRKLEAAKQWLLRLQRWEIPQ
jgi:hypothetical protein